MRVSNEMDPLSRMSIFLVNNANFFPETFLSSLLIKQEIHFSDDNETNRHDLLG